MKIPQLLDPDNPMKKEKVAVILNKDLINMQDASIEVIILGRAIFVSVKWHKNERIGIMDIYAPNVTKSEKNRK